MTQNAEYVFTGNAAQLLAEYQKLEKAKERDIAKLKAQMRASKESANENAKLARDVEQAWNKARTPAEAYNATLGRYKKALQEGMISQAQFNRLRDVELHKLKEGKLALDRKAEAERKSANTVHVLSGATNTLTGALASQATAALSVARAFSHAIEEQRRYRREAEETTLSIDDLNKTFAVQAGLDEIQSIEARGKILQVAKERKVTPEKAFISATQLVSSGFNSPQDSGTLNVFLKAIASGNLQKADPVELAKATGQFMQGFGLEKNAANLENVMVRVRGLFEGTDVQVSDLSGFAKAAPVFANANQSLEDTLSVLTTLRQTMEGSEAATFSRKIVSTLTTSGGSADKTEALANLGLTPDEVDLIGESLPEALKRLKFAVESTDEEDRAPNLKKIFEEATVSPLVTVLENLDNFGKFAEMQRDFAGFEQGYKTAESKTNAIIQQIATEKMITELRGERGQSVEAVAKQVLNLERAATYQGLSDAGAIGGLAKLSFGISNAQQDATAWLRGLMSSTPTFDNMLPTQQQRVLQTLDGTQEPSSQPRDAGPVVQGKDAANLERIARAVERTADAVANPGTKLPGTNPSNQANRVRP